MADDMWTPARSVTLIIPGEGVAKARPRVTGRVTYTPQKTKSYENLVKSQAFDAMADRPPFEGPVEVTIRIYRAIPKSARKRDLDGMIAGTIRPTTRPDMDNIIKSITDAMNKIVYVDDGQIVSLSAEKCFAQTPCVHVTITEQQQGGCRPNSQ